MEDLNINVIRGFGIKHRYITKEKSAYVCHTDSGKKIIKKVSAEPKYILFQHNIKNHLHQNGFCNLDMYMLSSQNKPYFEFNNERYTMTNQIQGRNAEFQQKEDFKNVILGVANFHKHSKGLHPVNGLEVYKNDAVKDSFERKINELASIKKRVRKHTSLSDFDVIFIKNYDYYMELMLHSKKLLENSQYEKLINEAKTKNIICHNFLKEENIFFNGNNELFLSNFAEVSIDPYIIDLAELIKRYVKVLPEDYWTLLEILEIYTNINPLSSAELQALQPLLLFPSKFLKICNQYYSKKRSWVPSALNIRIQNLIAKKNIAEEFFSLYTLV